MADFRLCFSPSEVIDSIPTASFVDGRLTIPHSVGVSGILAVCLKTIMGEGVKTIGVHLNKTESVITTGGGDLQIDKLASNFCLVLSFRKKRRARLMELGDVCELVAREQADSFVWLCKLMVVVAVVWYLWRRLYYTI